jgi:hypothetical protein
MGKRSVIFFILILMLGVQVNAEELCEEDVGEDNLEIINIEDFNSIDDDNWLWKPSEKLTIEVEIKNDNYTTRDFDLELILLDSDYGIIDNFTTSGTNPKKTINLDEDEIIKTNFSFQLDNIKAGNYFLYGKLYATNNESICTEQKARSPNKEVEIEIEGEKRSILIKKINGPTDITAGSKTEYTVEIINLGNVLEERVLVIAFNANLKLREEEIITNIAIGKTANATFSFTIPTNTTATQERIIFGIEYNYNSKTGNYETLSQDTKNIQVNIVSTQAKTHTATTTSQNQTENKSISSTKTNSTSTNKKILSAIKIPSLFWLIIPTILILLGLIGIGFYLNSKRKKKFAVETIKSDSKTNDYLKKIKQTKQKPTPIVKQAIKPKTTPSTRPSKPSGINTANTKTLPASQNPPQQPRSPPHPAAAPSSPKPKPASKPASPPTAPNPPQKSPPSPQPPKPDKTSSP